ncbi:MAG TPA: flagellar biosynthetic protein FliR [Oscillospiraceae bacterium]|nr:flagellar biosynthetic protein FliR [Oscillospiraceae bacterium]
MEFDYNFTLLLMIFMRMSGCVMFNPILGRRNLPTIFQVGLTLMLTLFTYPLVPAQALEISSFLVFFVVAIKELLVGFIIGFIIQMFMSIIQVSGEMIDMQLGVSMSKVYDPASNVSMPLSASYINIMFILIFFAANGHLTLVQIFTKLCTIVPYGDQLTSASVYQNLVSMFSLILIYAIKISLPVLAAEFITEIAVGLVMRAVPQIDVFTISIQLKVIIGFAVILIMVPPLATFLERLINIMFDNISHIFSAFV